MSLTQIKKLLGKIDQILDQELKKTEKSAKKQPQIESKSPKKAEAEIVLEIGHGPHPDGFEPGAVCPRTGKREWDLNKILAESCQKDLLSMGYTNISVEDENDYLFSIGRKHASADIFVSVHHNAFSDSSAQGTETLIHPNAMGSSHQFLAQKINKEISGELDNIPNRGVKTRSLGVLTASTMKRHENDQGVVLIEPYFLTGEDVDDHEDWSARAGSALARAIHAHLDSSSGGAS